MRTKLLILLLAVGFALTANGANIFTISKVEGHPDEEVTVTVSLDNSDTATAVDMTITLDRQLTYIDGSCELNSDRINGHTITGGADENNLRVVIYDLNGNSLIGNSGELFSFKLKLKKEPQTYPLSATAVISNSTGGSLQANVNSGTATILSPKLTVITKSIDYGHIPIRNTYSQHITLQNSGNEPLTASDVKFSAEEFSTDESSFTIAAGETKDIIINYTPMARGAISETVTFYSNAINGKQTAMLVADPFSVNELHVGSASGISDNEVTISLTMNNMETIMGMSCEFNLPEQLVYVDGSFSASNRAKDLLATSQVNGNKLSLVLFSLDGKKITGNDGEIATFKLKLNGTSGRYDLHPQKVVLSNESAEDMTSATSYGTVQIKSPTINSSDDLNMGDCSITETSTAKYTINNSGEATLTINKVLFLSEGYRITEQLPISIEPWQSQEITVEYVPTAKAHHSTTMQIYTNDPENRMKSVNVSGNIFEPNNITVDGNFSNNGYDLKVSLNNYTDIVALQMDIHWLPGMKADDIIPTSRLSGLSSSITKIGDGIYRVIIFSLNNTPISGNSGEIFTIPYFNENGNNIDKSIISIDNLVFSSSNSENMSSQGDFTYLLPSRQAESIALDKTSATLKVSETTTLTATVLPETTTVKDVTWTSSDNEVATVDNGVVTAVGIGKATITATTADGSGLSASCEISVVATPAESIVIQEPDYRDLNIGETLQLHAVVYPETTTDKSVYWQSSDSNIATVNDHGLVTAVGIGEVEITATDSNGHKATITIKVNPILAETIELNLTSINAIVGDSFSLIATITPDNTTNTEIKWDIDDENIATLQTDGHKATINIIKSGQAKVTVSTTDGSNLSASCDINAISSISTISIDDIDENAEYYTLQGIKLASDRLVPGIYIKRKGSTSQKVILLAK